MYLLAILAVMLSGVFMAICSQEGLAVLVNYLDIISLLVILVITIPILVFSGLSKDFSKAFRLVLGKGKAASLLELKRAKEAVNLVQRTLIGAGIFTACFGGIMILYQMSDWQLAEPNLAVAMLSFLYAVALDLILLPIHAKLEIKIAEYMQE